MYLVICVDCYGRERVYSRHQQEWDAGTVQVLLSGKYPHLEFFVVNGEDN